MPEARTFYTDVHNGVRKIAREEGWHPGSTLFAYNDRRKDGSRRLSYAFNGWRVPPRMRDAILTRVCAGLQMLDIQGCDVYWRISKSVHGPYDKLCIDVPSNET